MKSPAFSFYVRDWMCSGTVTQMSGEQVKAYVYLLCAAWIEDETGTLPNDDQALAGLARVDLATWNEIKPLILTKFTLTENGRLFNDRQYAEVIKQHHRSTAAARREHRKSTARAPSKHRQSTSTTTALENEDADENANSKGAKRTLESRAVRGRA